MDVMPSTLPTVTADAARRAIVFAMADGERTLISRLRPLNLRGTTDTELPLYLLRCHTVGGLMEVLQRGAVNRTVDAPVLFRAGVACSQAGASVLEMTTALKGCGRSRPCQLFPLQPEPVLAYCVIDLL